MKYLFQFIMAFATTIGFCYYFNAPKNGILRTGTVGGIGWLIYFSTSLFVRSPLITCLTASFAIGLCAEFIARRFKTPATTVIYPAIIPLVPGASVYYAMSELIVENYNDFIQFSVEAFMKASGLSLGIIISILISRIIFSKRLSQK